MPPTVGRGAPAGWRASHDETLTSGPDRGNCPSSRPSVPDVTRTLQPVETETRTLRPGRSRGLRRDLYAAGAAALLVTAAVLIGRHIQDTHHTLRVGWPPLLGTWGPHLGPGTPAAVLVATAVVTHGPALAARLRWRSLLPLAWGTSLLWTATQAVAQHRGRGHARTAPQPSADDRLVIPAAVPDRSVSGAAARRRVRPRRPEAAATARTSGPPGPPGTLIRGRLPDMSGPDRCRRHRPRPADDRRRRSLRITDVHRPTR